MKTQILKSPTQLQIIPESKFDDYLLNLNGSSIGVI